MAILKVAMIQQKSIPNNIDENLKLALNYINHACEMGADIVLFPEMWSNGYAPPFDDAFENPLNPSFEEERVAWLSSAISLDSQYINALRKAAMECHIGIAATYLSKTATKPQNTAIIIDRTGKIILEYAKVHTCDFSLETLLQSGDAFKVCTFDNICLGVMICYDREFPESARVLMLKGAEIILVPNACDMNPARINQLATRAFENMVGIAMANYPNTNWGNSCAFTPIVFDEDGNYLENTMVKADHCSQRIVMATFNLDEIRAYRKKQTWGNAYRKIGAYEDLLSDELKEPFIRSK